MNVDYDKCGDDNDGDDEAQAVKSVKIYWISWPVA